MKELSRKVSALNEKREREWKELNSLQKMAVTKKEIRDYLSIPEWRELKELRLI
jgi:hypothetical protein